MSPILSPEFAREVFEELGVEPELRATFFRLHDMVLKVHAEVMIADRDGEPWKQSSVTRDERYRILDMWNAGFTCRQIRDELGLHIDERQVYGIIGGHRKREVARNTLLDGSPVIIRPAIVDNPDLIDSIRSMAADGLTAPAIATRLRNSAHHRRIQGRNWSARSVHKAAVEFGISIPRVALLPCDVCGEPIKYNLLPRHRPLCAVYQDTERAIRDGDRFPAIAKRLNQEGRYSPSGRPWSPERLRVWTKDRRRQLRKREAR